MLDQITGGLSWMGVAVGILAVLLLLELLLRSLFTAHAAPAQNTNRHRRGTELPRVQNC